MLGTSTNLSANASVNTNIKHEQQQRQKEQQRDVRMQIHHEKSTDQTTVISPLRLPKSKGKKSDNPSAPKYNANDSDNSDEDDVAVVEVCFFNLICR